MALQRSTAVDPRLGALNLDPIMQANAIEQQSLVDLNKSVMESVENFQAKQEEKRMTRMRAKTLEQFMPNLGIAAGTPLAKEVSNTLANDPNALKSMSDLIVIGGQKQKLASQQAKLDDDKLVSDAIAASIGTDGKVDKGSLENAYLQLGGNNLETLESLRGPGEIVVDNDTGIWSQDGVAKGQVATSLLPSSQEANKTKAATDEAKLEKIRLENEKLRADLSGVNSGTIDVNSLTETDLKYYNEAMKNPESEESKALFELLLQQQQSNK